MMIYLKKLLITVLIHLLLCLYFSPLVYAKPSSSASNTAMTASITVHLPEMLAPPEKKIPVKITAQKPKKKWLWVLGGALLVGAIAAVAGDGDGVDGADDTGEVTVEW